MVSGVDFFIFGVLSLAPYNFILGNAKWIDSFYNPKKYMSSTFSLFTIFQIATLCGVVMNLILEWILARMPHNTKISHSRKKLLLISVVHIYIFAANIICLYAGNIDVWRPRSLDLLILSGFTGSFFTNALYGVATKKIQLKGLVCGNAASGLIVNMVECFLNWISVSIFFNWIMVSILLIGGFVLCLVVVLQDYLKNEPIELTKFCPETQLEEDELPEIEEKKSKCPFFVIKSLGTIPALLCLTFSCTFCLFPMPLIKQLQLDSTNIDPFFAIICNFNFFALIGSLLGMYISVKRTFVSYFCVIRNVIILALVLVISNVFVTLIGTALCGLTNGILTQFIFLIANKSPIINEQFRAWTNTYLNFVIVISITCVSFFNNN